MRTILDSMSGQGGCISYLARDLLLLICDWKAEADELGEPDTLPAGDAASELLSSLLEQLFALCGSETALILKANVDSVKLLIELWRPRVR